MAEMLKEFMDLYSLTQKAAAGRLGISQSYVSDLLKGRPGSSLIKKLLEHELSKATREAIVSAAPEEYKPRKGCKWTPEEIFQNISMNRAMMKPLTFFQVLHLFEKEAGQAVLTKESFIEGYAFDDRMIWEVGR